MCNLNTTTKTNFNLYNNVYCALRISQYCFHYLVNSSGELLKIKKRFNDLYIGIVK